MEISFYGVTERKHARDDLDVGVQELETVGFTIIDSGLTFDEICTFRDALDLLHAAYVARHGGSAALESMGEADQVRAPLVQSDLFLTLAVNPRVLELIRRCLGDYFILNQQNGIINRPSPLAHHQAAYHRDLPYQHFVASRPIAINALFCIDDFDPEVGSTTLLPGTHKQEAFPADEYITRNERAITAPAGSYLVMNSMLYHRAGRNRSNRFRRAVNNLYTLPFVKQQIVLPAALGGKWRNDATLARLLGYQSDPPDSIENFLARRTHRAHP